MGYDFNWNHLFCFYQVAKERSLKDAAKLMGLAPSTLSEQVKKLEISLGEKLFERKGRSMILTHFGRKVYSYSKKMFETGSKLVDSLSPENVGGYEVNVGIEESLADDIVTEFTSQYWDLYTSFGTVNTQSLPDTEHLVNSLLNQSVDWAITYNEVHRDEIEGRKIGSYPIRFFCSEEIYKAFKDKREILKNIPLARSSSATHLNNKLLNYFNQQEIIPKEFIKSDHINYLWRLCLRGRCVLALAEEGDLTGAQVSNGLISFELENPLSMNLFAYWRGEDKNLVAIQKLKTLISLKKEPQGYFDPTLQIEISDISGDLLN